MKLYRFLACLFALFFIVSEHSYAATVSIDPQIRYQTIQGFGAGSVYYTNWLTEHPNSSALYDTMFTGLGLSYLRIANWNQDTAATLKIDSIIVAEGKKRLGARMRIAMSSWSAPGFLKVSGQTSGTKNNAQLPPSQNTLLKKNGAYVYGEFAHWWKVSLLKYAAKGMMPDEISLQNEPDMNASYEGTVFAPTQNDTLAGYAQAVKVLHDTLATVSKKPNIIGPEPLGIGYGNFEKFANALDKSLIDGYAYHLYHGNNTNPNTNKYLNPDGFNSILQSLASAYTGKPHIMTEFCPMDGAPTPEADMLGLARVMINVLSFGKASGYINWELYWGDGGQMVHIENAWDKTKWTTPLGFKIMPEYHGIRHFSKFVNPGWNRIMSSVDDASLRAIAFASAKGDSLSCVVVNTSQANKTITITPAGFGIPHQICQSQVSGNKSSYSIPQSGQTSLLLPDSSISTIVWVKQSSGLQYQPLIITNKETSRVSISKSVLLVEASISHPLSLDFVNLQGKTIVKFVTRTTTKIALKEILPTGLYILRINDGKTDLFHRIIQVL